MKKYCALFFLLVFSLTLAAKVKVGADLFFEEGWDKKILPGKRIGLISNHTALNAQHRLTLDLFQEQKEGRLVALFAPEHGFFGDMYAEKEISSASFEGIPLFSLYGETRKPTKEMLKNIDLLVFDMQDIGIRSYTYISTLFLVMEAAAHEKIPVVVLDRPNPLGGLVVDGLGVEKKWRSFVGYAALPYCHGMTVGELARYYNEEYHIGVDLTVVPMRGWKREMTFKETGLTWIPTSPQIPEEDTPFFYATTGILGQFSMTSIGIGYTLPFKVIGAPWMKASLLADKLNDLKLPGVHFAPFYFRPFFGKFKNERCEGVLIEILNSKVFLPVTTQYALFGVLKALYPKEFAASMDALAASKSKLEIFHKINGTDKVFSLFKTEKYFIWRLRERCEIEREKFLSVRKKYLIESY